jgi:hypothetical protein
LLKDRGHEDEMKLGLGTIGRKFEAAVTACTTGGVGKTPFSFSARANAIDTLIGPRYFQHVD